MKHLITTLVAALTATSVWAEDRAALVIGNAAYQHGPRAFSAEQDVQAVADALSEAGFDVTFGLDLNRVQMRAAMDQFAAKAEAAEEIVIYYSGHAMRMAGRTFLAPIDFNPVGPVAVAMDGAPLAAMHALLAQKPGGAVLFLDAAQLTGFTPTSFADPGVAPIDPPEAALIVSAAEPGRAIRRSRWRMSAFAQSVVEDFLAEGADVMIAASNADGAIWTTGAVDPGMMLSPPVAAAPTASSDIAQQIELAFWQSTEASGSLADYQAYLRRYPNGLFADIARNRIGESSEADAAPATEQATAPRQPTAQERAAAVENALRLNRDERRQIQADLTELGFDTRGVDGLFGRGTRGAVRAWQVSEDLASTGYLTLEQVGLLRTDASAARAEQERLAEETSRLSEAEARERDDLDWARAKQVHTYASYQRYLKLYPDGRHADEARRILTEADQRAEDQIWTQARRANNRASYENYLDRYPNGRYAAEAEARYKQVLSASARNQLQSDNDRRREEAAWRAAEAENTPKAYAEFGEQFPDGVYAEEAKERRLRRTDEIRQERENSLRLSTNEWLSIEQRLASLGFNPGDVNGKVGKKLRAAIRDYRKSRGMAAHGYVDKKFIRVLVNETKRTQQTGAGQVLNQMLRLFDN